jgi:hypothetical protein
MYRTPPFQLLLPLWLCLLIASQPQMPPHSENTCPTLPRSFRIPAGRCRLLNVNFLFFCHFFLLFSYLSRKPDRISWLSMSWSCESCASSLRATRVTLTCSPVVRVAWTGRSVWMSLVGVGTLTVAP